MPNEGKGNIMQNFYNMDFFFQKMVSSEIGITPQ